MAVPAILPRERVTIVGILNATPDSFSDGGRFVGEGDRVDVEAAVQAGAKMVREGAHILDVGGESTRPGAREIPAAREIARTVPVIEAIAKHLNVPISIDTRKAEVAEAALGAGASIVNDVSALRFDPGLADVAARADADLWLCHSRGTPETMQRGPRYGDVLAEVCAELEGPIALAEEAGIPRDRILVDPGIGFGKRLEDNLALLARAGELRERLGLPVLVGPSRKSFLGTLTGDPSEDRDAASAAACAVAVFAGADAVRVHEVAGTARAVRVAAAMRQARAGAAS